MEIYGYGKWVDKKFTNLQQLHIYYGHNEAGKTTLMSFVHSILFGFPTKQSAESRYEPKESSRYGGRLTVTDTLYGTAVIERVKGKANGDVTVTLENGVTGSDQLLENLLYGIDKKTYQTLFSFDLDGLQKMQKLNPKQLNRYFLSIGALGNEQLLRVADKFEKQAYDMFKPTGSKPKINQKVRQVESKRKQVQKAKEKNQQYMAYYQKKTQLEQEIADSKEERKQAEKNVNQYQRLNLNWNHYAEMQSIQQQMTEEKLAELPEEGLYQLNNLQERISEIKETINGIHEELLAIQEKQEPSRKLSFYFKHEALVEELLKDLEGIQQQIDEQEILQVEVQRLEQQLIQDKFKVGLAPDSPVPEEITDDMQQQFVQMNKEKAQLEQEQAAAAQKLQFLHYQNESLSQQLDDIERQLWSQEEFQETENAFQKINSASSAYTTSRGQNNASSKFSLKKFIPILVGAALFLIGLILSNGIGYGLMAVGIMVFIWGSMRQDSKPQESIPMSQEPLDTSYEEYIQQKELKKQWQEKLAENDQVIADLNQANQTVREADGKVAAFNHQERELKEEYGFPLSFTLEQMENAEQLYSSIREMDQQIRNKERRIAELEHRLYEWRNKASMLEAVVFLDWNSMPSIINGLNIFQEEVQRERVQRNQLLQTEKEVHSRLQHWSKQQKELEQERTKLFRSINVNSDEEFRKKYVLFQNLTEKKNRLNVLESQLTDELPLYNQFRDQAELQAEITASKTRIKQRREIEEQKLNEKINCELSMKHLEEGGEYSVLLQERSNLESELQTLVDEWASYKAAAALIEQTLNLAKKDRFPQTIADTTRFFQLLTKGNYQQVIIEEEKVLVQRNDGTLFEATELSKGTTEQLYVALRFAFVKNTSDLVKLPLLIDDGFVNFDSERKNEMFDLMKQMSETTQVLYFTFDESIKQTYPKETIEML